MDGTRARALLGVSTHASPDELRRAFRRRVLSTHPDRGGDATSFDETVVAFRSLSARVSVARHLESVRCERVPFDAYDSTDLTNSSGSTISPRRRQRPSFADVLARVSGAAA